MCELGMDRIRTLKGAPLSVYVLLNMATNPVSQAWLERMSGYSDKPVRTALMFLREIGWVVKTPAGWRLAEGVQLLIGQNPAQQAEQGDDESLAIRNNSESEVDLSGDGDASIRNNSVSGADDDGILNPDDPDFEENRAIGDDADADDCRPGRKNSGPGRNFSGVRPDSAISIISIKDLKELKELKGLKDLNNNNNNKQASRKISGHDRAAIWEALGEVGIYRNGRTEQMIMREHVTADYIRTLAARMEQDGHGGPTWSGLFVLLCERGEPVRRELSVQEKVDRWLHQRRW